MAATCWCSRGIESSPEGEIAQGDGEAKSDIVALIMVRLMWCRLSCPKRPTARR